MFARSVASSFVTINFSHSPRARLVERFRVLTAAARRRAIPRLDTGGTPVGTHTYFEASSRRTPKSAALSDAPPIRPPSTSGCARSSAAFFGFIEPPY